MIVVEEISAEQFAKLFHHYHEALAPDFACNSTQDPGGWDEMPANERHRLVAAARLALLDLDSGTTANATGRERYFAKHGQAEWGS